MDEAMHPLTLDGRRALRQGAAEPERRAAAPAHPVEVRLQGQQVDRADPLHRQAAANDLGRSQTPHEYGFYANVNPECDHPRWSQARERRLPSSFANAPTLMFNGYADQVASLYTGMDLKKFY